jgi:hypothetical protein
MGRHVAKTTSQDTCLKMETNAFAVKKQQSGTVNHLNIAPHIVTVFGLTLYHESIHIKRKDINTIH